MFYYLLYIDINRSISFYLLSTQLVVSKHEWRKNFVHVYFLSVNEITMNPIAFLRHYSSAGTEYKCTIININRKM